MYQHTFAEQIKTTARAERETDAVALKNLFK